MISRDELIRNEYYWIETIQNKLFNDISEYIDNNKISQSEIAERMGVSKGRVSQLLSGNNMNYQLETLVKLCLAMEKIPSFELIDFDNVVNKEVNVIQSEPETHFELYKQGFIESSKTEKKCSQSKVIPLKSDYIKQRFQRPENILAVK